MYRKFIIIIFSAFFVNTLIAQHNQLISTFTTKTMRFGVINEKDISSKWSYFGYSDISRKYDSSKTELSLSHLLNRKIYKGLVSTFLLNATNEDIMPGAGIGVSLKKNRFNVGFYPAVSYGIVSKNISFSTNAVVSYTPPTNNRNWNWYSMLIVDADHDFKNQFSITELLSVGLQFKRNVSFGLNLTASQQRELASAEFEPGLFLGLGF